jgi:hypothetical protein
MVDSVFFARSMVAICRNSSTAWVSLARRSEDFSSEKFTQKKMLEAAVIVKDR